MTLTAQNVSWRAGGRLVVDGVDLEPEPLSTVGLLGPNGSGKSSLLRLLSGVRETASGAVLLDGEPIAGAARRAVARRVAVVEQNAETETDLTVADVVGLGRIPHRRPWSGPSAQDDAAVRSALERVGMAGMAGRRWHTLSGGERQRAQIARALAQEPRELLLDEPTNHLDIGHQLDLLDLVARLPVTAVVALHDLNLAAMYCDRILLLDRGRPVAAGTPAQVLTEESIAAVYGVRAELAPAGPGGRPWVRFLGRC
ncbi:ABC transporter ATP-binding protein [Nocardiopsis composta]|uniref:Iron complex transport system ATP-binding protein n=1 Tax=Nocardiopsis composta TaxID=157465 RepID=A0A7W8QID5_9ACTN|nr:ABC transporter ATP-binding protein [Nocardiopsis composta]MBB5430850.1 iron complex transport system ATP-binding protein [Nocardiopsis composta]